MSRLQHKRTRANVSERSLIICTITRVSMMGLKSLVFYQGLQTQTLQLV